MKEEIKQIFQQVFTDLHYNIEPHIIKSNRPELCDFQCNEIFKLSKILKLKPEEIGKKIEQKINEIPNFDHYFTQVNFIKPGFINIIVSDKFINAHLRNNINNLGIRKDNNPQTYIIDYGGPNIAKPLHVGHIRPAVIGESVKRILQLKGNKTIADVHLGDIGLQIGQVIYGILQDYKNIEYQNIEFDINYLEKIYPKMSALCKTDPLVKEKCEAITKKLQEGDSNYRILWHKICTVSIRDIKRIYKYLDIHFDLWLGESDSYKYFDELTKKLEQEKVLKLDDGAKIIDVKEKTDKREIPPFIYQKSNGAYLYSSSDLATIYQRVKDYNPDDIIYVTDARQELHFKQLFRAVKKANISDCTFEHLGFGMVNGPDNKPYKTRDGDALKLDLLISEVQKQFISSKDGNQNMPKQDLDKIVNSIIKFADLQNNLEKSYIFDIKKFSEITGKTGPYILYTYLRINKLLTVDPLQLSDKIYSVSDRKLRIKLLEIDDYVNAAYHNRRPHFIADYVYDLALLSNNFYQNNRMDNITDKIQKQDLNTVLTITNKVLKKLLNVLIIDIPSKM